MRPVSSDRSADVAFDRASGGSAADASARTARAPRGAWAVVRQRLHDRGLRWTPQRRLLVEVLAATDGHITGAELVERCQALDPAFIPSTVYRTLDVLEDVGYVRHAHGLDGREEFHVLPEVEHGHLHCSRCGSSWEIEADQVASLIADLERHRGFAVELGHLSVVGTCRDCRQLAGADRADV